MAPTSAGASAGTSACACASWYKKGFFQCCHFDTSYNLFHLSSVDDFVSFIYTGKVEKVVLKPYDLKELNDVAESELLLEMISIGEDFKAFDLFGPLSNDQGNRTRTAILPS